MAKVNDLIQHQTQTIGNAHTDLFYSEENQRLATVRLLAWKTGLRFRETKNRDIRGWLLLARVFKTLPDAERESKILANKDYDQQSARCFRDTDVASRGLARVPRLGARACKEERGSARAADSAGVETLFFTHQR
jgi:hypothetical protein